MAPDPRWLEILKASGWQTAAIALACAAFLGASRIGWLPPLEPWVALLAWFAMLVTALLALMSFLSGAATQVQNWLIKFAEYRVLRHAVQTLNSGEIAFLKEQVEKGETTVYLHPFNTASIPKFTQQASLYRGLETKGILDIAPVDLESKIQAITIRKSYARKLVTA